MLFGPEGPDPVFGKEKREGGDLDAVAPSEGEDILDPLAVDEGAVGAAKILERRTAIEKLQARMLARNQRRVDMDIALGEPAEHQGFPGCSGAEVGLGWVPRCHAAEPNLEGHTAEGEPITVLQQRALLDTVAVDRHWRLPKGLDEGALRIGQEPGVSGPQFLEVDNHIAGVVAADDIIAVDLKRRDRLVAAPGGMQL